MVSGLVTAQAARFVVMALSGAAAAMGYQLFTKVCTHLKPSRQFRLILQLIFWACAALVIWQFIYYCTYGQLYGYCLAAFATGVILWKLCFYDIINHVCVSAGKKWRLIRKNGKEKKKQSV